MGIASTLALRPPRSILAEKIPQEMCSDVNIQDSGEGGCSGWDRSWAAVVTVNDRSVAASHIVSPNICSHLSM